MKKRLIAASVFLLSFSAVHAASTVTVTINLTTVGNFYGYGIQNVANTAKQYGCLEGFDPKTCVMKNVVAGQTYGFGLQQTVTGGQITCGNPAGYNLSSNETFSMNYNSSTKICTLSGPSIVR